MRMIKHFISKNKSKNIDDIITQTTYLITTRNIQKLIDYSVKKQTTEITAMLMDYKHKHFPELEDKAIKDLDNLLDI